MKETWAEELKGNRIRITNDGIIAAHMVITRLDTNEPVENVRRIIIDAEAGGIVRATLWLVHIYDRAVHEEAVVCENPELALSAHVSVPDAIEEIPIDTDTDGVPEEVKEVYIASLTL